MNTHNNGSTPLSNSSAPTVPPNMTRVRLLLQQQQRHPQQQPSPQQQLLLQQQQQQQQYLDQLRRGVLLGGVDKIMSIFTRMRSEMEEMVLKERKSKEDILAILQRQRDDLTKLASEREELEKILNRQNSELTCARLCRTGTETRKGNVAWLMRLEGQRELQVGCWRPHSAARAVDMLLAKCLPLCTFADRTLT